MHRFAFLFALGGALLGTSTASAQGWLADRGRAQGPGFRVGSLELHPGLGVEGGYDSNLFFENDEPDGVGLLRVTAHLILSTLTAQRQTDGETEGETNQMVKFSAGLSASYYHFFTDRVGDNVGVDGNFDLIINPSGRFVFRLYDTVGRTIRPFSDAPEGEGRAPRYARVQNSGGVELTAQTRGGTLSGALGYRIDLDYFEDASFDYLNNLQHVVHAAVNWKFFPSTALVSRTEAAFLNYFDDPAPGVGVLVSDNRRVKTWLGVNGAFTPTISFTAMVGYSVGFYGNADTDDFDNVLAHAEIAFAPRPTFSLALGYKRDFRPSFIGNFTKSDQIYLRSQLLVGGSFLLGVKAALGFERSGLALGPTGDLLGNQERREDIRLNLSLFGEYRFTSYLALSASIGFTGDYTDFVFAESTGPTTYPDAPAGFNKFDAWLGVRVFY